MTALAEKVGADPNPLPENPTLVQAADWLVAGGIYTVIASSNLARDSEDGLMTVPANLLLALASLAHEGAATKALMRAAEDAATLRALENNNG